MMSCAICNNMAYNNLAFQCKSAAIKGNGLLKASRLVWDTSKGRILHLPDTIAIHVGNVMAVDDGEFGKRNKVWTEAESVMLSNNIVIELASSFFMRLVWSGIF